MPGQNTTERRFPFPDMVEASYGSSGHSEKTQSCAGLGRGLEHAEKTSCSPLSMLTFKCELHRENYSGLSLRFILIMRGKAWL